MPEITVDLRNADPALKAALAGFVAERGIGDGSSTVRFDVETTADCDAAGVAIAEFIAAHPGSYELLLDGPEALARSARTNTAEEVAGSIGLCAGLL